ncbi:aquaporin family protein [Lentisphaerota bacterium ZTH]|nr:aquaporin family protein [Lentisphaerota bacterium ZTH]
MSEFGKYFSEFIGTAILIIFGSGVCAGASLKKSKGQGGGWIVITTGWGFAVALAVYVAGWAGGAHINPAVTLGLAAVGKFSWSLVPGYICAQLLGAITGACIVFLAYKRHFDEETDRDTKLGVFCTAPAIRDYKWNFVSEFIGTAVLLIGLLGIINVNNGISSGIGPFLVGVLIWAIGLSLGSPTGYAINPARDLGPRIAHALLPIKDKRDADWKYALVPILGPVLGGITGSLIYVGCEKVFTM